MPKRNSKKVSRKTPRARANKKRAQSAPDPTPQIPVLDHRPRRIYPPLPGRLQRFIEYYVGTRDLEIAAERCGMPRSQGPRLWKRGRIRREIVRRLRIVEDEQAKYAALAIGLTRDRIDAKLNAALDMPALPGTAPALIGAIKLAFGRIGVVVDPESKPSGQPQNTQNPMYTWLFAQKQQEESANASPQTLEGKLLPAASVTVPFERPRTRNEEIRIEIDAELVD